MCSRTNVIVGLTATLVLPLCLLKKLDALKYTSLLGLSGTVYCAIFMLLRLFDGSYQPGGRFHSEISPQYQPDFGTEIQVLKHKSI